MNLYTTFVILIESLFTNCEHNKGWLFMKFRTPKSSPLRCQLFW